MYGTYGIAPMYQMWSKVMILLSVLCYSLGYGMTCDKRSIETLKKYPFCEVEDREWLPSDQAFNVNNWLINLAEEVTLVNVQASVVNHRDDVTVTNSHDSVSHCEISNLHPPIQDFKEFIESDVKIRSLFHQMFSEVPAHPPFDRDPNGDLQIRDYCAMLHKLNSIVGSAPEFRINEMGGIEVPITSLFSYAMKTKSGFLIFLHDTINYHLKRILNYWAIFLGSKDSRYVLNDGEKGWLGQKAMIAMPDFVKTYKCDPSAPYYGFASWDDFFTREFRDGARPVTNPNDSRVIVNACESAPYNIEYNVKRNSTFWIKSQPYSIVHMLANDPLAEMFVGGTVYQGFLSSVSYHRWHSPVDGKVHKVYIIDGTYFSVLPSASIDSSEPGPMRKSQAYITQVATRALIFIEADNPYIGMVAFLAVGMEEISSCEITVKEGQHVTKGEQLGMFHFGGSTYCLTFRQGVNVTFDLHGQTPGITAKNIPINAQIATVP